MELPKSKTVEKLFKISQNRPIIFYFSGWATTPLYRNLGVPKTKKRHKII